MSPQVCLPQGPPPQVPLPQVPLPQVPLPQVPLPQVPLPQLIDPLLEKISHERLSLILVAPESCSALWFPELAALSCMTPWPVPMRPDTLLQAHVSFHHLLHLSCAKWCIDNHAIPLRGGKHAWVFTISVLGKSLAFSTVKVYMAAVSAGHVGCDGKPVFSHPLVKRFLRGARRGKPGIRGLAPHWDFPIVLHTLSGAPFEPFVSSPLDALSFKTALLLALVSAKRASELTALSVSPSCPLLNRDSSFVLLRPNPAFLPRNIGSSFRSRDIVLKAFHPPPHSSKSEAHLLCPARALATYVQRSAAFRSYTTAVCVL
ncbi:hypothetical protein N1851_002908 [Merluccius polli]|uniref:Uncharacterized protein n=1 Tax=Merluccius polli TaxID=89951 RepID=A0AA47PAP8_MERPO|nr:hypothetical protein N1851_002908 [Merluccius polli]